MIEPLSLQKKGEVLLNTIIYSMLVHFPKAENSPYVRKSNRAVTG